MLLSKSICVLFALCSTALAVDTTFVSKRTPWIPERLARREDDDDGLPGCDNPDRFKCDNIDPGCQDKCNKVDFGKPVMPSCFEGKCYCGFSPGIFGTNF